MLWNNASNYCHSVVSDSATPWTTACQASLVLHQLLELAQTHVRWVSDAIQPSHPLSLSPPAFSLSQLQGLFQWVNSSDQVAKLWKFRLQHQSFRWIFRTDFLSGWQVGSPCSPRDFQESSLAPQFKSINSSVLRFQKYIHTYIFIYMYVCVETLTPIQIGKSTRLNSSHD